MTVLAVAAPDNSNQSRTEFQFADVAVDPVPFLELRILAECYYDTQQNRIACVNRMERGGVDPDLFVGQIEALTAAEHQIELALVRRYRRLVRELLPGVWAWQQREKGIGEKLMARLLGQLGHPRVAFPYHWEGSGHDRQLVADPPFYRSVAQLRSYCGFGDPARRRRKGMTAEEAFALGNPRCKTLTWLLAESAVKRHLPVAISHSNPQPVGVVSSQQPETPPNSETGSAADPPHIAGGVSNHQQPKTVPNSMSLAAVGGGSASHNQEIVELRGPSVVAGFSYRWLYEQRRNATAAREGWTAGHQHADALRVVAKAILKDLWVAAGERP